MKPTARRIPRNTDNIKRTLIYALVLFLLAVLRVSFFARIEKLPASPDLVLAAVVAIAVIDKREVSSVSGIIGGVMTDALGGVGIYISPLFYFTVALVLGTLAKKMMQSYTSWAVVMLPALAARALFTLVQVILFGPDAPVLQILRQVVLPECICTAIFSLLIYPLICLCILPLRRGRDVSLR